MGGGGKNEGGSGVDQSEAQLWYDFHYNQGVTGAPFETSVQNPTYMPYGQAGHQAGMQTFQQQELMAGLQSQLEGTQESLASQSGGGGYSYADIIADAERKNALKSQQLEQAQLRHSATVRTDAEIERERANARLRGVDYDITPEQRQERIQALIQGGAVVGEDGGGTIPEETILTSSRGVRPRTLLTEDTLDTQPVLG